jgi:hypothetical protein
MKFHSAVEMNAGMTQAFEMILPIFASPHEMETGEYYEDSQSIADYLL